MNVKDEDELLETVALQNANSVFIARQRAEQELLRTKEQLQAKTAELEQAIVVMEEARRTAQAANEAKSRFLRMVSHELRTPLGAIAGYASLLTDELYGPLNEAQLDAINRIRRNQKDLLQLVDELLEFARIESGHLDLHPEPFNVNELLEDVQSGIEPQLAEKTIEFDVQLSDPPLIAVADRKRVHQIILNLLSNAAKFTETGGHVSLSCSQTDGRVRIHVRDTGIGVAPDKHQQIFESFYQVQPSMSGLGGTGLGLAISRQLAHSMNGELAVKSALGRGSTFTLILPSDKT